MVFVGLVLLPTLDDPVSKYDLSSAHSIVYDVAVLTVVHTSTAEDSESA